MRSRGARASLGFLGQHLVRVVFQGLRLGHEGQRLLDLGIPVGQRAQPLQLAELDGDDLFLDVGLQPIETPLMSARSTACPGR